MVKQVVKWVVSETGDVFDTEEEAVENEKLNNQMKKIDEFVARYFH